MESQSEPVVLRLPVCYCVIEKDGSLAVTFQASLSRSLAVKRYQELREQGKDAVLALYTPIGVEEP